MLRSEVCRLQARRNSSPQRHWWVSLQAQLEWGGGREQQPGQLPPDAGVRQRLYIAVAQLRAVATAGASAGLRLVDDGDLQAALLKFIRRGQADDACAQYTYLHRRE